MTEYTDKEIYQFRKTWIEFLKRPDTKKGEHRLDSGNGERCCLGHACFVLGVEKTMLDLTSGTYITYGKERNKIYAPVEIQEMLGLWSETGSGIYRYTSLSLSSTSNHSLADVNDLTTITPQEIGAYLETVIMGGEYTPFKPINV